MSRVKRVSKIRDIAINKFINLYFDDKYPNDEYSIDIMSQQPLLLRIQDKKKDYSWTLYSASSTNHLLNDIKIDIFKKHLSAYRIQMWWKKIFYDPKNPFIEAFMDKKYNELLK